MKSPGHWQASPQDETVRELWGHPHVGIEHVILGKCRYIKFIATRLK